MKTENQLKAWNKLNSLYESYHVKPLKYGFTQQTLKDSKPYDVPGFLSNWSQDKRKTQIPDYKEQDESEGTKVD